jgi:hypothetical protein
MADRRPDGPRPLEELLIAVILALLLAAITALIVAATVG